MNGESREFNANVSEIHISDEDLENFNDNVNSAMCVCNPPGKKVFLYYISLKHLKEKFLAH